MATIMQNWGDASKQKTLRLSAHLRGGLVAGFVLRKKPLGAATP
jgi:hypothetical protein